MKTRFFNDFINSHKGENRTNRRFATRFNRSNGKSYFVLSNEVIEMYRRRELSAIDIKVFSYLSSLRMHGFKGFRVGQKMIAFRCGITENTVRKSVYRLYNLGLIERVIIETREHCLIKFKTSVYTLQELPESGFFFIPRRIFFVSLPPKMFTIYLFMCRARSFEYEKSWNSYNDIAARLGFGKGQRSEVVALIGGLVERGLIKKTVRRMNKVFVDNVYRVTDFKEAVLKRIWKNEKRSGVNGTLFSLNNISKTTKMPNTTIIISSFCGNVNPLYIQCRLDL
ncbi:MAG: hypothetical protein LBC82_07905 [Oscillospiraceae bacterium]|jgi:predicted transcriptional regulator|nr:hypothetical protein [Oscillospiraceae bacterium]